MADETFPLPKGVQTCPEFDGALGPTQEIRLEDLKKVVAQLIERYGRRSYLKLDAGYNNISAFIRIHRTKETT